MPRPHLEPMYGPLTLARARELGLRDHDWRSAGLHRITRTVRASELPGDVRTRARAFALALPPDAVFSHVTAAQLWGLPLPRALEGQVPLDVMRPSGRGRVARGGCIAHRGVERRRVDSVHRVRVTGLVDTWLDLGEVLGRGLTCDDLVVAGDVVAGRVSPGRDHTAREQMASALERRTRPRGGRALSAALELVRPGVRSPMETRARLMFSRAGFPESEVNAAISAAGGGWLAEGDLVWRLQRVVGEYQGAVHAGIRSRSDDTYRSGLLTDEGWRVLEIFSQDVFDAHRRVWTLTRFARALALDLSALSIA